MADFAELIERAITEGVVVRPGDTLVVRVRWDHGISAEDAERIRHAVKDELPGVDCLIVAADQLLVYRPGEVQHG